MQPQMTAATTGLKQRENTVTDELLLQQNQLLQPITAIRIEHREGAAACAIQKVRSQRDLSRQMCGHQIKREWFAHPPVRAVELLDGIMLSIMDKEESIDSQKI